MGGFTHRRGPIVVPGAPAGGLSPYYFRLDPTAKTQLYTAGARVSGGAAIPTLSNVLDAQGRPVLRVTSTSANSTIIPLMKPDLSGPLEVTGQFIIRMRANFNALGQGARAAGVCFNADTVGPGITSYAVAQRGASLFDTYVDGANENFTTSSQVGTDAAAEQVPLWVVVQLDYSVTSCTYHFGSSPWTRDNFVERRKTALRTPGKGGVGLFITANVGTTDISELVIYKPEYLW